MILIHLFLIPHFLLRGINHLLVGGGGMINNLILWWYILYELILVAVSLTITLWICIGGLFYPTMKSELLKKVFWFPWRLIDKKDWIVVIWLNENEFINEWNHFCNKINFAKSALDNRAIVFMNNFPTDLKNLTKRW